MDISVLKNIIMRGVPIIVCQQYTKEQSIIGHFRIVVGIGNKYIYLHDPDRNFGGKNIRWTHEKFFNYWQATGMNVTGGTYFLIEPK